MQIRFSNINKESFPVVKFLIYLQIFLKKKITEIKKIIEIFFYHITKILKKYINECLLSAKANISPFEDAHYQPSWRVRTYYRMQDPLENPTQDVANELMVFSTKAMTPSSPPA